MTPEEITARIADLKAKLARRENQPGFKANAEAIRDEIARLENDAATHPQPD